jgi:glycosyltransferase involved in cell wall biosynthesis
MAKSTPRLFVALIGDIDTEPSAEVKYGHFLRALESHFSLNLCDATLRGIPRLINAIQVFSPNIALWKERFYQNVPSFQVRSKKVAAALRRQAGSVDAVLQIGVLYDALWEDGSIPGIIYTDYTSTLASRKPELGRSPHNSRDLEKWLAMEKRAYQRAAHICTRGEYVRQSVIDDYGIPESKVTAIGGGVNFDSLPDISAKEPSSVPTALFIGKDFYRKGGDILLRAFEKVRETIPNARLIMVSEGFSKDGHNFNGVELVQPTWDRKKIQELYTKADCFVLPSRLETWGDVILEAMSFGLPCIGVCGEAMSEIIVDGKTGLVIPPENQEALSNALIQLLSNRETRETFGNLARKRIEDMYTWKRVAEKFVSVFKFTIHSTGNDKKEERLTSA